MKNNLKILIVLLAIPYLFIACRYKEIADAKYPDQIIYMPAAVEGIYYVTDSPDTYEAPTPESPYSYSIDLSNNRVIVPLSIFRAGISRKGTFSVDIMVNNDTVTKLIESGTLANAKLLPPKEYLIPDNVEVRDGNDHATFNLSIDLSFLQSNPEAEFAIGIKIASNQRKVNPLLSTAIVVIDAKVINH